MSRTTHPEAASEELDQSPVPWSKERVEPIVAPHLGRFAQVLTRAWEGYAVARDEAAGRIGEVGPASRGMVVSDLTRGPAQEVFAGVDDVQVVRRFDRPWVHLAGGRVQVRFRKLTSTLAIAPGQSDRSRRLAFHLPDPTLPVPELEPTILTAGYLLDVGQTRVEQMVLVCHVGFKQVHYFFPLPGGALSVPATQLSLTPLSPPIIRSARAAAVKRLARELGQS